MMRELGSSNKVFYYNFSDRGTFNMQIHMQLKQAVDPQKLRLAIGKVMPRFPEFAIKPVFNDGHLYAQENKRDVVVRKEDGAIHYFADDDTNGFLFYFSYEGEMLKFSCFHGMADFKGYMVLLRTILYEYALAMGFTISEEDLGQQAEMIRLEPVDMSALSHEAWDPYGKFAGDLSKMQDGAMPQAAAVIHKEQYPEESSELNCYEITFSTEEYHKKAKELGTSSASLMTVLAAEATYQMSDVDRNKPVVAMLPVDLRRLFEAETLENFSDGIFLATKYDELSLPLDERCAKIKASMKAQITRENFLPVMFMKVKQVEEIEKNGKIRSTIEGNIKLPPTDGFSPLTYALTYPGSMSMGPGLDDLLENVEPLGFARASSIVVSSFGDRMRILLTYRSDDPNWPEAVLHEIRDIGIAAEMKAIGKCRGDIIKPDGFLD